MDLLSNLAPQDMLWFIPLVVWTVCWKGIALWKCGRKNQLYWFIAILILNTLGVLEIIYLAFFQKKVKAKK